MPTFTIKTQEENIITEILYGRGQLVIHRTPCFDEDLKFVYFLPHQYSISHRNGYLIRNVPSSNIKRIVEATEQLAPLFDEMPDPDTHCHDGDNYKWIMSAGLPKKINGILNKMMQHIQWDEEARTLDIGDDYPDSTFYEPGPYIS